jgi:F-type H+/Na+-transporting ATPase subunit alpha
MLQAGLLYSLSDGIGQIKGLSQAAAGELIKAGNNLGMILNLEQNMVKAVFFSENHLKVGDRVFRLKRLPGLPASFFTLNSVTSPLGDSLEQQEILQSITKFYFTRISTFVKIDEKAPGIIERQSVYEPVLMGIQLVDSLIPIGAGQRELIIGDRQTGKTAIAVDAILSQTKVPLIYRRKDN